MKLKEKRNLGVYKLIDCEDGQLFVKGSKKDILEYLWKRLNESNEVGGYSLKKVV